MIKNRYIFNRYLTHRIFIYNKDNTIPEDHGILRRAIKDEEIKQEDDIALDYKEDPLANGMISEEALKVR